MCVAITETEMQYGTAHFEITKQLLLTAGQVCHFHKGEHIRIMI